MSKKKSSPIPDYLRLTVRPDDTPEKKAEIKARLVKIRAEQDRLRAEAQARGRLSPEARRMQLGMAHEMSARTDVEMLEAETPRQKDRLSHARARLAEALALQGRYNEAADVEHDKEKKAHYAGMWEAVWRDDEETCPCEPFVDGEISLTHDHVSEEVISQKHGNKLMPAIRCNDCGHINVRPLTHELRQRQRAQEQAAGLLRGESADSLKHNARELLSELHDRRVLRR